MPGFLTGAIPSPRHKLLAAPTHVVRATPPSQVAFVPPRLSVWGNKQYGNCVTAEEAFARACYHPEIFIDDQTVISWAEKHNVLNGATLTEVLDAFQSDGFLVGGQRYNDGPYVGVDWTNDIILQSAISSGPVKIAIDHTPLPSAAGEQQGWYALGDGRTYKSTDHCVALNGYGPAEWLFQQLNVPLPSAVAGKQGYLLFTWGSIGFVDHAWIVGTCIEAWLRNPTTVGVPPLPGPSPTPTPIPPPSPTPPVCPPVIATLTPRRAVPAGGSIIWRTPVALQPKKYGLVDLSAADISLDLSVPGQLIEEYFLAN